MAQLLKGQVLLLMVLTATEMWLTAEPQTVDSDFRAKGTKLVVEAENWLCLLRSTSRRWKLNLPGLIFKEAPQVSQQKAKKREAVPCIFRKKICTILLPSYPNFKELKRSQEPRCVNAGTASRFPRASLRIAFATNPR